MFYVCNSSSSDFIATQSKACICYGNGMEKEPYMVTVPFTKELDKIREGEIVTLNRPLEGWSKDYKLMKIWMDIKAEGQPVFFFFQEVRFNGTLVCEI